MAVTTAPIAAATKPGRSWSEPIAFLVMVGFFLVAPLFIYPLFLTCYWAMSGCCRSGTRSISDGRAI
jgi:hypothetical protein